VGAVVDLSKLGQDKTLIQYTLYSYCRSATAPIITFPVPYVLNNMFTIL